MKIGTPFANSFVSVGLLCRGKSDEVSFDGAQLAEEGQGSFGLVVRLADSCCWLGPASPEGTAWAHSEEIGPFKPIQPKWLRPIDPLVAASLPSRIDPPLGVDDDTARRLQIDAEPVLTIVTYS
jgi:hypothetical protein